MSTLFLLYSSYFPEIKFWQIIVMLFIITIVSLMKKKIKFKNITWNHSFRLLFLFLFIVLNQISFSNEIGIKGILSTTINIFFACIYSLINTYEEFKSNYLRVMKVFSIISLIFFTLTLIVGSDPKYYERVTITLGSNYSIIIYNFITYKLNVVLMRNSGFTWEPGAFQLLLNIALFYEIIRNNNRINSNILIYSAAILTTFSSTGYLILLVNMFFYFIQNLRRIDKKKYIIILLFIISIIILLYLNSDIIFSILKEKLTIFNSNSNSLKNRIFDLKNDIKIFKSNVYFGIGLSNFMNILSVENQLTTNSITSLLATSGIVGTGLYLYNLYSSLKKTEKNYWFLFIIILLGFTNEYIYLNPFILYFIFLNSSFKLKKEKSIYQYLD